MKQIIISPAAFALLLCLSFGFANAQKKHEEMQNAKITKAVTVLHPTKGHSVSGIVWFEVVKNGVWVIADV